MTVINEMIAYENYYTLKFVEFLELLCRGALKATASGLLKARNGTPAAKVEALLDMIIERMKKNGVSQFYSMEIIKIDREIR